MIQQQQLLLCLSIMAMDIGSINGSCSVTRIIMRVPQDHDIGLLFDLTVSNLKKEKSEILDLSVSADGICTLNTTGGDQVLASSIFGGEFGPIDPSSSITVSLVWPTVSLYNRVGSCPIIVSSVNHKNEVNRVQQILHFDTRFETLDPGNHSLRRRKNFVDCRNWDKNYFQNCTPLNCEELYFGKRSFYNGTTEQCEPVPVCNGDGIQYDFYANECLDTNSFITDEEIEQLKQGKFDNNYMELHEKGMGPMQNHQQSNGVKTDRKLQPRNTARECNFEKKLSLVDFNNCFQHLNDPISEDTINARGHSSVDKKVRKKSINSILKSFYYDWYLPLKADRDSEHQRERDSENEGPIRLNTTATHTRMSSGSDPLCHRLSCKGPIEWLALIWDILLIMLSVIIFQFIATVVTYIFMCLALYGLMELLAMIKPYAVYGKDVLQKLTPRDQQSQHEIMTSASLMSLTK